MHDPTGLLLPSKLLVQNRIGPFHIINATELSYHHTSLLALTTRNLIFQLWYIYYQLDCVIILGCIALPLLSILDRVLRIENL